MIPQHGTLEISKSRLAHNLNLLQHRAGKAIICPVVKANAYGHGIGAIARLLPPLGIQWLATYNLQEAVGLSRETALKVLALSPVVIADAETKMLDRLAEWSDIPIRLNVTDLQTARALSNNVPATAGRWPIHVQIDTGLTRVGVAPSHAADLLQQLLSIPTLHVEGIFSHLSHGDSPHHPTLEQQLATFSQIAAPLKQRFPDLLLHLQNSGGTWHLDAANLDMVRIGISLYGLQPSTTDPIPGLQPIARVTAPIIALHLRPAGTGIGYGHTFVTARQSLLAVVPVGYADGYPRLMSNRAVAQVCGRDVPVVGRVSMDQIILDVTDLTPSGDTRLIGESVTVICWDASALNSLDAMADTIGTIGYELATHLGSRLQRVVVD